MCCFFVFISEMKQVFNELTTNTTYGNIHYAVFM